jgi:hypothetical protein
VKEIAGLLTFKDAHDSQRFLIERSMRGLSL